MTEATLVFAGRPITITPRVLISQL